MSSGGLRERRRSRKERAGIAAARSTFITYFFNGLQKGLPNPLLTKASSVVLDTAAVLWVANEYGSGHSLSQLRFLRRS
jgi:hypothetical protein